MLYSVASKTSELRKFVYRSTRTLAALGLGVGLATVGLSLSAQANAQQVAVRQAVVAQSAYSSLPDGIYLYGQSAERDQIGAAYMVFQVEQSQVTGAFYMPSSSFDCFQGEFQGERLALNVVDSYEQTVHPYSVALAASDSVASTDGSVAPVSLQGFHQIQSLDDSDRTILATCQADFE